jgi:hypothetical protein
VSEKIAEYRAVAEAAEARNARRIEDQVDPGDCFISSWADGLTASLYREKARIEEQGGMDEFWGLFNLKGERVRAKLIDGKYGMCWALCNEAGQFTGKFVAFVGSVPTAFEYTDKAGYMREVKSWTKKVANQAKKGYREGKEMASAEAFMNGEGHGLSGRAWVAVKRTDGGYPENAVEA